MEGTRSVTRHDFIRRLMDRGLPHAQATLAYETVMETIEEGVSRGDRVYLRQVGSLFPTKLPPGCRTMHTIHRAGGIYERTKREFYLGTRLRYTFRLFRSFKQKRDLKWNL